MPTAFFAARPDVRRAYLFGSQARGEAAPLSDVDLAVVLDPATTGQGAGRDDLNAGLMQILRRNDVDLVLADGAPPLLRHRVVRHGLGLFAREPVHGYLRLQVERPVDAIRRPDGVTTFARAVDSLLTSNPAL